MWKSKEILEEEVFEDDLEDMPVNKAEDSAGTGGRREVPWRDRKADENQVEGRKMGDEVWGSALQDDGYEDNEAEEEVDDDDGSSGTVILIAFLVAAITAVAGVFVYRHLSGGNSRKIGAVTESIQTGSTEIDELVTEVATEVETASEAEAFTESFATNIADEEYSMETGTVPAETSAGNIKPDAEPRTGTLGNNTQDGRPLIEIVDGRVDNAESGSEAAGILDTAAQNTGNTVASLDSTNTIDATDAVNTADTMEKQTASVVMIGDTRFREMANIAQIENCGWACSSTADFEWFVNDACPGVDSMIVSGTKVLISIGLNDIGRYTDYAATISKKAEEWQERGATVYFVSVGPVAPDSGISNTDICAFNTYMFQNLAVPFIDVYNYLVSNGFESVSDESKSYTEETTLKLCEYISQFI